MIRFFQCILCLVGVAASAAVPTNRLVADFHGALGRTTNSAGYLSRWDSQVAGGIYATQATAALQPKAFVDEQGRDSVLFHDDPAVPSTHNEMTWSTLTNYTRGFSLYFVGPGMSDPVGSQAIATFNGYGAGVLQFIQHPTGLYKTIQGGASTDGVLSPATSVGVYGVSSGTSGARVWRNFDSQLVSTFAAASTTGGVIGAYSSRYFKGPLYRLLIYDVEHSQSESSNVVAALAAEHSVVTDHDAILALQGDSMTASVGQSNWMSWPRSIAMRFPRLLVINFGWGGRRIGDPGVAGTMIGDAPTMVDRYLTNFPLLLAKPKHYGIQAGVNDISSDGLTGAQAYGRLKTNNAAREAAGWSTFVVTIPNKNNLTTAISNYNVLIRAGAGVDHGWVSDSGSDPRLLDSSNTNFFQADLFHLNDAGEQIVADWAATNIQTFIGRTFYVDTTGSDSNSGTSSEPFGTIQHAVDNALPGDHVLVRSGNYDEEVSSFTNASAAARITIEGEGWPNVNSLRISHTYHTVKGLRFTGTNAPVGALLFIDTSATGLSVVTNRFWPTVTNEIYGIDAENGSIGIAPADITLSGNDFFETTFHAVDAQGTNWMIRGNRFEGIGGWDAIRLGAFGVRITENVFTNWSNLTTNGNHPDIIQAFLVLSGTNWIGGSAHVLFERNWVVNGTGTQIGNVSDDGEQWVLTDWEFRNNIYVGLSAINVAAPNFRWYNNLFYRCGNNTGSAILFRNLTIGGEGHNGDVRGNIFFECGANSSSAIQGWVSVSTGITNVVQDFNLVVGVGAGKTKDSTFTDNGWNAHSLNGIDPLFVDAAALDFRPRTNSPLIGAGVDLSATGFTNDFTGATRTGAWTIGPIQVAGAAPPPAPPSARVMRSSSLRIGAIRKP